MLKSQSSHQRGRFLPLLLHSNSLQVLKRSYHFIVGLSASLRYRKKRSPLPLFVIERKEPWIHRWRCAWCVSSLSFTWSGQGGPIVSSFVAPSRPTQSSGLFSVSACSACPASWSAQAPDHGLGLMTRPLSLTGASLTLRSLSHSLIPWLLPVPRPLLRRAEFWTGVAFHGVDPAELWIGVGFNFLGGLSFGVPDHLPDLFRTDSVLDWKGVVCPPPFEVVNMADVLVSPHLGCQQRKGNGVLVLRAPGPCGCRTDLFDFGAGVALALDDVRQPSRRRGILPVAGRCLFLLSQPGSSVWFRVSVVAEKLVAVWLQESHSSLGWPICAVLVRSPLCPRIFHCRR